MIKKLKEVIREVFYHYYQALDNYHRLNNANVWLYRENEHLTTVNDRLKGENDALRSELKNFRFLRKILGSQQIDCTGKRYGAAAKANPAPKAQKYKF